MEIEPSTVKIERAYPLVELFTSSKDLSEEFEKHLSSNSIYPISTLACNIYTTVLFHKNTNTNKWKFFKNICTCGLQSAFVVIKFRLIGATLASSNGLFC